MKIPRLVLVVLVLCLLTATALAAPIVPSYWVWNAPAAGDVYQLTDDSLFIRTAAARNIWNAERGKAPMYTTVAPAGDWTFEAKFNMPARVGGTHVGLVLWNGANTKPVRALYFGPYHVDKISVEGSYAAAAAAHPSTLRSFPANSGSFEVDATDFSGWLRIQKVGNQYRFFCRSTATESWRDVGVVTTGESFPRIGFIAKGWGGNGVEVTFSDIYIYK